MRSGSAKAVMVKWSRDDVGCLVSVLGIWFSCGSVPGYESGRGCRQVQGPWRIGEGPETPLRRRAWLPVVVLQTYNPNFLRNMFRFWVWGGIVHQ